MFTTSGTSDGAKESSIYLKHASVALFITRNHGHLENLVALFDKHEALPIKGLAAKATRRLRDICQEQIWATR
jgi:hypothetical protein